MMTAKQHLKMVDLGERLLIHGRLIEQQVRELDEKGRALLVTRVIAGVAVAAQLITLYQWLVAPALECYR